MVSLYVHGHKSFQIDAWLMDSISCKFPICFTGLQNELEEDMQVLGDSTQKHGKPLLLVERRHEKLQLGREGMSAFPWFPRHSESKIRTGSHLQSKIELTTGHSSPKWFRFTLRNCKERNHPHGKPWRFHGNWDSQFLLPSHLTFSFQLSLPPSY